MNEIELGSFVEDVITGFTGVVTGLVRYITGCNQALVAPRVGADGALRDAAWFDVQRLRVAPNINVVKLPEPADGFAFVGFDKAAPVR